MHSISYNCLNYLLNFTLDYDNILSISLLKVFIIILQYVEQGKLKTLDNNQNLNMFCYLLHLEM